ncbi:hypothetical protein APHAL10511_005716 [Amanita phalloides]|nr:hypothetical protein APHAL10511_005716 [Amanita phalloides]
MRVYFGPEDAGAVITILSLSLSAVSFPALSKHVPFFGIPHIIFFIGKHFGTGVILSTAFCHLLDDAFEALNKPLVKERYGKIGKWTGLIILSSLLAIFLVEYVSTSYVDYLQADPSTPPTPIETPKSSRSPSKYNRRTDPGISLDHGSNTNGSLLLSPDLDVPTNSSSTSSSRRHSCHMGETSTIPIGLITNSRHRSKCCLLSETCLCDQQEAIYFDDARHHRIKENKIHMSSVGRKRQVIGILVLQLGIMIHSLVIGLTLSITQGADFASLLVAICFHQVFEGLSLGIRIDALPSSSPSFLPTHDQSSSSLPLPSSESTRLLRPRPSYSSIRLHLERSMWAKTRRWNIDWLKISLPILFAITTPLGMLAGFYAFPHGGKSEGESPQRALMLLTQGVMSAVSAGMLIYAATVEMLAADFVFGDVSGGHSHPHFAGHHGHTHGPDLEYGSGTERPAREHVFERELDAGSSASAVEEFREDHKGSTVGQKALAVVSLFAGVVVMNITSLFE